MFDIDREHPEYIQRKPMWRCYRDLYAGGQQMKFNAGDYLTRRQKEPLDVYGERVQRVFYENYIGSIVDWYAATLFRREPVLLFDGESNLGRQFLNSFCDDCDLKGTTLTDFFRRTLIDSLVGGASHILVDFPTGSGRAGKSRGRRSRGTVASLSAGIHGRRVDQLEQRRARAIRMGCPTAETKTPAQCRERRNC